VTLTSLDASADPPPAFDEAVKWFFGRVPVTDAIFAALTTEAQRRAVWFAGGASLAVVTDVWSALDQTLTTGGTLADFKRTVGPAILSQWQGSVANPAWRMELIFRNATQRAYSFGRVEQLRDPAVARVRPFWFFDAVGDARTSEICRALDGTVLPASDPWWASHTPPCHHACRSIVRGLRASDPRVARAGNAPPPVASQQGFGTLPGEDEWQPRRADYPPEVWDAYLDNPRLRPQQ
jgi:SPP1 gp7 family putative phage head morphogenesis protein